MKTLVILQPSYLPWLGYFDQIAKSDCFVFYDDVQFDKHGWRNRNRIKSQTGDYQWITVPVQIKGKNKPSINEVEVVHEIQWPRKHIMTLKQTYRKSPYQSQYIDELEDILKRPFSKLCELNITLTKWLCTKFDIQTEFFLSSELGVFGGQSERLIRICKHLNCLTYLSGNSAKTYLDETAFNGAGIKLIWHDYEHPHYPQADGNFLPFLSAIDLLFNVGPDSKFYFSKLKRA